MSSNIDMIREFRKDMSKFAKVMLPGAIKFKVPKFHYEIYDKLQNNEMKKVCVAAPRGTAKSTLATLVYPLWLALNKKPSEDIFIVIISESRAQSVNFISRIKYYLEEGDRLRLVYGRNGEKHSKRWREDDIILSNGARIVAVGTGQRVRGFIEKDTRPTHIICDDVESELNSKTPESRIGNRKWITEAVMPSMADHGKIVFIGTVIHEDCFLCYLREDKSWDVSWYQIINEEDGSLLWEERFPMKRVLEIKASYTNIGNPNGFYQEYMNIAQSPDERPFKPEYFKMHSFEYENIGGQNCLVKHNGDEKTVKPVNVYMGIDPASSLSGHADYFAMAILGVDNYMNRYIIDLVRKRVDPKDQPKLIIDYYLKYKPLVTRIETVGYQEALRSFTRELMKEKGIYIPGLENGVKPRNSKSERLFSLVPILASGRFYFRHQDVLAMEEFLSFPKGKHDDFLDSIYYALESARSCSDEELTEQDDENKEQDYLNWKTI